MRGFVGHLEEGAFLPHNHRTYLWTHLHFSFGYYGNQVVEANVSTVGGAAYSLDDAEPPVKVTFTYSVSWIKSTKNPKDRNKEQQTFFPKSMEVSLILWFITHCLLYVII
jgi:transmembrane 9 superfamily protein 1